MNPRTTKIMDFFMMASLGFAVGYELRDRLADRQYKSVEIREVKTERYDSLVVRNFKGNEYIFLKQENGKFEPFDESFKSWQEDQKRDIASKLIP